LDWWRKQLKIKKGKLKIICKAQILRSPNRSGHAFRMTRKEEEGKTTPLIPLW
jgi:hypothetical protein